MAVGYRVKNIFPEHLTKLNYFFCVAGRAEPASPAGKSEQVFIVTVGTADSGKALFQITAFKIGPDNIGNDWAVKAVVPFKTLSINLFEMIKVILEQMVQRRVGRFAWVINRSRVSA